MFISRRSNLYRRPSQASVTKQDLTPFFNLNFDSNLWTLFGGNNSQQEERKFIKNICHHLKCCTLYLEQGLKTKSPTAENLRSHYDVARTMIRLAKISLLKEKLLEEKIDIAPFSNELEAINRLLSKIYIAYEKIDFALPLDYTNGNASSLLETHRSAKNLLPSNSLENENELYFPSQKYTIEKKRAERIFQHLWKQRLLLIKFNQLTQAICKDSWEEQLKEALKEISTPLELCQIAKILNATQILKILSICSIETPQLPISPYILVAADENTLEEILHCLSYDNLALKAAKKTLEETANSNSEVKKWVEESFYTIRQTLVDTRNKGNSAIDDLCKKFREHLYVHHITKEDLNDIDELLFHLNARKNNVQILKVLFQDILENKTTLGALNQLIITYESDIARLIPQKAQEVCGNVWKIISENAFEVHDYISEDCAFECLALWHLTTAESLLNCALVTCDEFQKEIDHYNKTHKNTAEKNNLFNSKEENLHSLTSLALERLKTSGINTIGDFEERHIYNINLLKNFLENQPCKAL